MATREAPRRAGTTIDVENPATGEVVGTVPALDQEDVAQLVARGRDAQPGWDTLGFEGRGEVLTRARRWLGENASA